MLKTEHYIAIGVGLLIIILVAYKLYDNTIGQLEKRLTKLDSTVELLTQTVQMWYENTKVYTAENKQLQEKIYNIETKVEVHDTQIKHVLDSIKS